MEAREIWVSGTVQGVFFRKSTQEKAQELKLHGWVRNLKDGRVQIWAQGDADQLSKLEQWAHQGPPKAEVTNVEVEHRDPREYASFIIDR